MPESTKALQSDRPTEGFTSAYLPAHLDRPMRVFLPADYQPKYAYPLVVLLHANGADEDAAARLAPQLSRRNYITVCPRGSVRFGPGATGRPSFGWCPRESRSDDYLPSVLAHAHREFHIHAERVYFIGIGEGAAVAYRLGLSMPGEIGGVIALNGRLPAPSSRSKAVRGLRVFVGHGTSNPMVPVAAARKSARLLSSVGADVRFSAYPTTHQLHDDMLRDVNRWIMDAVNADPEQFPNING